MMVSIWAIPVAVLLAALIGWWIRGAVASADGDDGWLTEEDARRKLRLGCVHPEDPDACCALAGLHHAGYLCRFDGQSVKILGKRRT